jgi:adenylate cyclase
MWGVRQPETAAAGPPPAGRRVRSGRGWRPALAGAVPGILVTLLVALLHWSDLGPLRQLGLLLFDTYQRAAPRAYEPVPVRIVDIDDETIARHGQWPWPRLDMARLTEQLSGAGAAAIAFDIVFSEPDRTSPSRVAAILEANPEARGDLAAVRALADHDAIFAQALGDAPAVLGFFLAREPGPPPPVRKGGLAVAGTAPDTVPAFAGAINPLPLLADPAAGTGFLTMTGDRDGIVRRAPLVARVKGELVPALSLEALRVAQGAGAILVRASDASGELGAGAETSVVELRVGEFVMPTDAGGELWMHYTRPVPERIVPAWKLIENRLPEDALRRLFEGHIVFVGTGAQGLRDLVSTPVSERELGVMVHAQAVEQMILGRFLKRPDWATGAERALLLLFGIGLALLLPGLGALLSGLLGAVAVAGTFALSWLAFRHWGLLLDPVAPALAASVSYVAVTAVSFWREEKARAYIRQAFDRYLSPELVERIAADPGQLELGGEDRDMTVMFLDVRGFSRLSEAMGPRDVIAFLVEFLTPMTDILLAHKATIDKYIGDAILAFWNAPVDDPDHAANAARATLAMVRRLAELNAEKAGGLGPWPGEIRIGIGLNTGLCCVGNIGSAQRLNYSLIGDTVNLASRIEGQTKAYGVTIAMGEETARRLPGFALLELDRLRVVGRDRPETIFALLGDEALGRSPEFLALSEAHGAMLAAYRAQAWAEARAHLAAMAAAGGPFGLEKLADLYRARIDRFEQVPPGPGWDGVADAESK